MSRPLLYALLLALAVVTAGAEEPPRKARTGEDLEAISEFNRAWWHWRRCVSKSEQVHGPSQDGKPPQICGAEPEKPKGPSDSSGR